MDDCFTEFRPRYFAKVYIKEIMIRNKQNCYSPAIVLCIQPHFCPDKCVGVDKSAYNWQLLVGMSKMFHNERLKEKYMNASGAIW